MSDIDPETGWNPERDCTPAGFKSLRARLLREKREAMIFDNEIDWVTRLKRLLLRREAFK